MSVLPVLAYGDPFLRSVASPVTEADADWRTDATNLMDTLDDLQARFGVGRALAAPQIGSGYRMIAFNCDLGRFVAVNPVITWRSAELMPVWDDCFSFPGQMMAVMRHRSVSMTCWDEDGTERTFDQLDETLSELVQHEVDHLDGILMRDRLTDPDAVTTREQAAGMSPPAGAHQLQDRDAKEIDITDHRQPTDWLATCPAYRQTPLRSLPQLAESLGWGSLLVKDESDRMGLGSFKALGGAYAVMWLAHRRLSLELQRPLSAEDFMSERHRLTDMSVCCASAGNHGLSVAAGAKILGIKCEVFLAETVA
jgi:peptide deformylase